MSTVKIISNFSQIVNCFHIDEHVKRTHMMSNTYKIGLYVINKSRARQKNPKPLAQHGFFNLTFKVFFIFSLKSSFSKLKYFHFILNQLSRNLNYIVMIMFDRKSFSNLLYNFFSNILFIFFFAFYFKLYIYLTNYRKTLNRHREEKKELKWWCSIEKNKILSRRRRTTKSWNTLKSKIVTMINKLDL